MDDLAKRLDVALAELGTDVRSEVEPRIEALKSLTEIGRNQLAALISDESADSQLRTTAIWISGLIRESALADVLARTAWQTRKQLVVWEAIKSLCMLGEGTEFFLAMIREGPSNEHRKAAAYALGRLAKPRSAGALAGILSNQSEPSDLRAQVAEALAYIGEREVFGELAAALSDPSPEVRFWSVFALGNLGDVRAVPLLEAIAEHDHTVVDGWWEVSREATAALQELRRIDG